MTYESLKHAGLVALALWLGALMVIVLWRLLVHVDALSGLLETAPGEGQEVERTQSLAVMIGVLGYYVLMASKLIGSGEAPSRMPELPEELLTLIGSSQAVFLAGKTARIRRG
ncbi:MAG: hypothetical protein JWQ29_281 [Phenylobacterium sp.]|nr:hypothetical protein [Phenylobacterium sp.]